MINEGDILWEASDARRDSSHITKYMGWLADRQMPQSDYWSLFNWSIQDPQAFWQSQWDYFDILHDGEIKQIRTDDPMPKTRWFTGTRLNYAEHVLRHAPDTAHDLVSLGRYMLRGVSEPQELFTIHR